MSQPAPAWRTIQHLHIGTLNIVVQHYGGIDWVLMPQLAQELGITLSRLQNAVAGGSGRAHVLCASFPSIHSGKKPVQGFARTATPVVASRLRLGTNNKLLRLANHADEIAGLDHPDLLSRQVDRVKKSLDAQLKAQRIKKERVKAFVEAYETAKREGHEKARAKFTAKTGASRSMYAGFIKGDYQTAAAKEARRQIEQRDGEFKVKPPRRGRKPAISEDVISAIRLVAAKGHRTDAEIAATFGVAEATVVDIVRGRYMTKAAQAAGGPIRRSRPAKKVDIAGR